MSRRVRCSLISCPEAYLKSLESFNASLPAGNHTLECIEEHVVTLIADCVGDRLENQSPFSILSVGSGDGENDVAFLENLSKVWRGKDKKAQIFARAIEPDKNRLEGFRAKAEHLPESLKSRADIEFEWFPITYQQYVVEKKKVEVKFDVIHFIHSIYYTGFETALEHCYEKELGEKGIILAIMNDEDNPFVKYGRVFSGQGLLLVSGVYCSNKDISDVAKKNGWKYVECPGETRPCDITAIFDRSSPHGNKLLDFLTQRLNVRETVSEENLTTILNFWQNECVDNDSERKMIRWKTRAVLILKRL